MNLVVKRFFSYAKHLKNKQVEFNGFQVSSITQEWIDRDTEVNAHLYNPLPVVIARGKGNELFDVEGRRF